MKANDVLKQGKLLLKSADIVSYNFDAAVLFEHCYNISRTDLFCNGDIDIDERLFLDACQRYANGEPLQYIIGKWWFYDCEFLVNPAVLIPRADTEPVVDYVRSLTGVKTVLDICTGTGCIGITLAKHLKYADVTLADISADALDIAQKNIKLNSVRAKTLLADVKCGYEKYFAPQTFDVIVSNPPYIKTADLKTLEKHVQNEPMLALDGGEDGTDFYKALIFLWKDALKPGGRLVLEAGYDTADAIVTLFTECGYADITTRRDTNGITRVISAMRKDEIV